MRRGALVMGALLFVVGLILFAYSYPIFNQISLIPGLFQQLRPMEYHMVSIGFPISIFLIFVGTIITTYGFISKGVSSKRKIFWIDKLNQKRKEDHKKILHKASNREFIRSIDRLSDANLKMQFVFIGAIIFFIGIALVIWLYPIYNWMSWVSPHLERSDYFFVSIGVGIGFIFTISGIVSTAYRFLKRPTISEISESIIDRIIEKEETPLNILKKRFARGEIDKDQYEKIKKLLEK